jgi:hypothetical protein
LEERNKARNSGIKPNPAKSEFIPTTLKWTPPPHGMVLVSCEALIFEVAGCMRAGMVMRVHRSPCLVAFRQHFDGLLPPKHAEALVLHRVLELDHEEGKENVNFVLDYLLLVQRLNSSISLVVYLASNIC